MKFLGIQLCFSLGWFVGCLVFAYFKRKNMSFLLTMFSIWFGWVIGHFTIVYFLGANIDWPYVITGLPIALIASLIIFWLFPEPDGA